MKKVVLAAETGSDITPELAGEYGIYMIPMHVAFGETTLDDGTFSPEKIREYYRETGKLPKTSGSVPEDFTPVYDEIHEKYPEAQILYLAYSAVTTCSCQSGIIAADGRDYIHVIDTKQVSVGQGNVVVEMAKILNANPDMTIDEAVGKANDLVARARMCFMPDNLEFLRAGGRVSNVAYLGSRILNIHPTIEIMDGRLIATKKYRGKMEKVAAQLIRDYAEQYDLRRDELWLVHTVGLSSEVRRSVEDAVKECGFEKTRWIQAGGVITTHGGPAAFGLAGFART